jgi:predicted RNA polymerase sigma factor
VARDQPESRIDPEAWVEEAIQDDQLRLIFTCCHPLLPQDDRIALALREVCGLSTQEIASAFLVTTQTRRGGSRAQRKNQKRIV